MSPSAWGAVKLLMAAAGPLQYLVVRSEGETHLFCNRQAVRILERDGLGGPAFILRRYWTALVRGNMWADRGWKFLSHYLDPCTGRGLGRWPSAQEECEEYFWRAVTSWRSGDKGRAFFYLGAAVHLVQDLCVPYHACGVAFDGHQRYEGWVRQHYHLFKASAGGYYQVGPQPGDWVYANARLARQYYPRICNEEEYPAVTAVLLDHAQRTTAGFMAHFFSVVS